MSALRPLPPRPSLEFERKEAKALLRRLRAGDPETLVRARARHPSIDASAPAGIRLADAHLVIAREYGFTSWPRLVRYFGDLDRQRHNHRSVNRRDFYDASVRGLIAEHRDRRVWAARALAAYVPRFYGMRNDEVFASTIIDEDACLAVARVHGFPSWEELLERTAVERRERPGEWDLDPMQYATKAMEAGDLDELRRVVEAHPDLLHPSDYDVARGRSLLRSALHHERRHGVAAMRPIMDWLATQGFDVPLELNRQLCTSRIATRAAMLSRRVWLARSRTASCSSAEGLGKRNGVVECDDSPVSAVHGHERERQYRAGIEICVAEHPGDERRVADVANCSIANNFGSLGQDILVRIHFSGLVLSVGIRGSRIARRRLGAREAEVGPDPGDPRSLN